jgi:hypothetical protein
MLGHLLNPEFHKKTINAFSSYTDFNFFSKKLQATKITELRI